MAGNANSGPRKAKVWRDMLLLTLNRTEDDLPIRGKTHLETLVLTQVHMALGKDGQSIRDIADRIDGKPAQALVGGDDDDPAIKVAATIERIITDPANPDSKGVPSSSPPGEV